MPEYADIYALSKDRDRATIYRFLDVFIPKREEAADECEIPQYSNAPRYIFRRADELIDYCCQNRTEVHTVYWRSIDGAKPEHAMVFFLPDGHIVCGLSTDATDEILTRSLYDRLQGHFDTNEALLYHEACPPETAVAFREEVKNQKLN